MYLRDERRDGNGQTPRIDIGATLKTLKIHLRKLKVLTAKLVQNDEEDSLKHRGCVPGPRKRPQARRRWQAYQHQ